MEGIKKTGIVIQGFDIIDISKYMIRANKRHQAILLSKVEEYIGKNHPNFDLIRKMILDETSENCRDMIKFIFGDIEIE